MRRAYDRAAWRQGVRPAVLARDGYRCQVITELGRKCGARANEAGHRVALVNGGQPYAMHNVEAQCRRHNAQDGARIAARRSVTGNQSRRW